MITNRSLHLDAFLATVDFRSPASLLEAAVQLEATLAMQDKRIYDKSTELDLMRRARDETSSIAHGLRIEAARLRQREDFEGHPSFAEQNDSRIKGDSPNPEVANR